VYVSEPSAPRQLAVYFTKKCSAAAAIAATATPVVTAFSQADNSAAQLRPSPLVAFRITICQGRTTNLELQSLFLLVRPILQYGIGKPSVSRKHDVCSLPLY